MKGWHSVFQTQDKAKVEEELRGSGQDFSWKGDDLRITSQQTAVEMHPVTGQKIWFNHILVKFIWGVYNKLLWAGLYGEVYMGRFMSAVVLHYLTLLCSFNLFRSSISQCCLLSCTECTGVLVGSSIGSIPGYTGL